MSHLFSTLEPTERHQIARLLAQCPTVALRAGDVRAHDDVPNASLLLVEEGILVVASALRVQELKAATDIFVKRFARRPSRP